MRIPKANFDAEIEVGIGYIFTDYLDNMSVRCVDLDPDLVAFNLPVKIMSNPSTEQQNLGRNVRYRDGYNITQRISRYYTINDYSTSGEVWGGVKVSDVYNFTTQLTCNANNTGCKKKT